MKNLILISLLLLCACHKSKAPAPSDTLQIQASNIGLQLEHNYKITVSPLYGGMATNITFHSDYTITESSILDTITYHAAFVYSSGNSTSLLQNGSLFKVKITDTQHYSNFHPFYSNKGYYSNDTIEMGTYLVGNMIIDSKPTLACVFPINYINQYAALK